MFTSEEEKDGGIKLNKHISDPVKKIMLFFCQSTDSSVFLPSLPVETSSTQGVRM